MLELASLLYKKQEMTIKKFRICIEICRFINFCLCYFGSEKKILEIEKVKRNVKNRVVTEQIDYFLLEPVSITLITLLMMMA